MQSMMMRIKMIAESQEWNTAPRMPVRASSKNPNAIPMAAKIPANFAISKGFLTAAGAAPGAATAVVVASALAVRFSKAAASFSSADLVNFSLHQRPNLR